MTFPPAGSPPPPPAFSRPFGVILLGILNALGALLYLGLGALLLIVSMAEPEQPPRAASCSSSAWRPARVRRCVPRADRDRPVPAQGVRPHLPDDPERPRAAGAPARHDRLGADPLLPDAPGRRAPVLGTAARGDDAGRARARRARLEPGRGDGDRGHRRALRRHRHDRHRRGHRHPRPAAGAHGRQRGERHRIDPGDELGAGDLRLDARGPLRDARVPDRAVVLPQRGRHRLDGSRSSIAAAAEPGPRSGYTFRLLLSPDQTRFVYWAEPAQAGQSGDRAFCVTETFTVLEYLDYRSRGPFAPSDPDEGCPAGGRTL